jgi:hypothetical protein
MTDAATPPRSEAGAAVSDPEPEGAMVGTPADGPVTEPGWSFRAGEAGAASTQPAELAAWDGRERRSRVLAGTARRPRTSSLGPPGRHRMPAVVVLLTVATLGVYGLVWYARTNREMRDFDPRMSLRSNPSTWAVVIPWLATMVAAVAGGVLLAAPRLGLHSIPAVHSTVAAALLAVPLVGGWVVLLMPFAAIGVALTHERVRVVQELAGATADGQVRPAAATAWLVLPVIGGLVLMVQIQRSLNAVWDRIPALPGIGEQ